MVFKQFILGVILLQALSLSFANTPEICSDVKKAANEMESYLQNQSISASISEGEKKYKDIAADHDKIAARLTVLRGIMALRSSYDQHLNKLMLSQGLDAQKTEDELKDFLVLGNKLIGLDGIIRKQIELKKPLEGEELTKSFGPYCKDPANAQMQGLSIICHSISATNDFNVANNITIEPDQARQFFERFLEVNNYAWEDASPEDADNLKQFNELMLTALNRGTKDVRKVLDQPDQFSLAFEKEMLKDSSILYKKFGIYASCIKNKNRDCEKVDPRVDNSYAQFVDKIEKGLTNEGGLAKYKPFIFAELEKKFGSLDRMSEIISGGVNQETLLQISHPVLNDIYRSLELAYTKNGPQSFKDNPNLAAELPKIINDLKFEVNGLNICGDLLSAISSRQNGDNGLASCINGLNSEVLGQVSSYIEKLEGELEAKNQEMIAFNNQPHFKEINEMKYELLGYLVTNCSSSYKQVMGYCNAETDLNSAFKEVRFLEGGANDVLIELDRQLDTKVYSINKISDYCTRDQKYPLPSVAAICTGIKGKSIAVTNREIQVVSDNGAKIVRPPLADENFLQNHNRQLAQSYKSFKALSKDGYVEYENGVQTYEPKNTFNDNMAFAIQKNQGAISDVIGMYFYGKDDGMLDLQLQQTKMQYQAQLQYEYNMNSLNQQTAQYQQDYLAWYNSQMNNGQAFDGWSYGYDSASRSNTYQQYIQNRTGILSSEDAGYNFGNNGV